MYIPGQPYIVSNLTEEYLHLLQLMGKRYVWFYRKNAPESGPLCGMSDINIPSLLQLAILEYGHSHLLPVLCYRHSGGKKLYWALCREIDPGIARPSTIDKTTGRQYIMPTEFEWDGAKAASNIRDHDGVTFEQAAAAFSDKFAVEWINEREDYGEERSILLGMTGGQLLYVAFTERGTSICIISAHRVTRHEQDIYFRQNAE